MRADELFTKGQRVRLSVLGYQKLKYSIKVTRGTVDGFSAGGLGVRVKPDGRKTSDSYYIDFWEAV